MAIFPEQYFFQLHTRCFVLLHRVGLPVSLRTWLLQNQSAAESGRNGSSACACLSNCADNAE